MAKSKKSNKTASMIGDPMSDEWQVRDDVDRLMRADEVHSDAKRLSRAHDRISSVASRIGKKKQGRSSGRSGGR